MLSARSPNLLRIILLIYHTNDRFVDVSVLRDGIFPALDKRSGIRSESVRYKGHDTPQTIEQC
jgi:hypothetical protein